MKFTTKNLVRTAVLLAICIVSQFFKNLSPYLTGPVVNTVIIIAVLSVGLGSGIIIGIISPITALLIAASPVMLGIPLVIPAIMGGNILLAFVTWFFYHKCSFRGHLPAGLAIASFAKAAFMGIVIVLVLLPLLGQNIAPHLPKPGALPVVLQAARINFSLTQLIVALTGSVLALLIWAPLQKYLKAEEEKG